MPKYYNLLVEAKVKYLHFMSPSKTAKLETHWVSLWNIEGEIPSPDIDKFRTNGENHHHEELKMRDKVLTNIEHIIKLTI